MLFVGAQAYLTKEVLHDDLIGAIRAVHDIICRPRYVPGRARWKFLRLIVQGLSNKWIAFELRIAEDTVKDHVKSILKKLGADDRTRASTKAIRRGIIHLQA